ncbi:MAG: ABC transporter ATP-binding protein [Puniceicoccales bacterium]|jgi:ABC-2 type transport system ATP-binding protein|nr:ABC transporter ATP-binding protein [Puniceicoccales bacterium]
MAKGDAIVVSELIKKYCGQVALNAVSFSIERGSVVGLIGPNGAGKSSILKILAGIIMGTSGDVIINGCSVAENVMQAKQHVSFMPENNPLPDHLQVGEYLRFRAELKGIPTKKIRQSTEKVMRQCDLYYEARHRMIKTLSKGYRQRVGIADAMLGNNEIVILDEPTIGLDPHQIIGVRKIIDANKGSRTILLSSHILSELETVCDNFIIINRGRIVATGSLDELSNNVQGKNIFCARIGGNEQTIRENFELVGVQIIEFKRSLCNEEYVIKFEAADEAYRLLLLKISNNGELFVKKIGHVECSLEEIFLNSTRRCRDQDNADDS